MQNLDFGLIEISVKDQGMGIKKDDWEMPNKPDDVGIFKMFEK